MKKEILKVTAIAGTLDIIGACVQAYLAAKISPSVILNYIASGLLGKSAANGGFGTQLLGLLIHYCITFFCVLIYYLLYPKLKLYKINWILNALMIAVVAWVVTALIVVPLSQIPFRTPHFLKSLLAITILFFTIGLPISFFAKRYYQNISCGNL